jgi:hypothetical protein
MDDDDKILMSSAQQYNPPYSHQPTYALIKRLRPQRHRLRRDWMAQHTARSSQCGGWQMCDRSTGCGLLESPPVYSQQS